MEADPEQPIEVRRWGERRPAVVLLHGGPGAAGSVASLARLLAPDFGVLEPLQRRSGGAPLTVAGHVADLATVAPARADLVGWSWGAMLALSYAARHPQRVRSLALIGCGTYDPASRRAYHRAMDERLGPVGREEMDALRLALVQEADPIGRDRLFSQVAELSSRAQAVDPLDDAEEPLALDSRGFEETWQDALRLQQEGIEPASFQAIRAPVLMLHGRDDPHPGPATRDTLRPHLPQLEYVELDRCGHAPWLERQARERFLAALGQWLSGPRGPVR